MVTRMWPQQPRHLRGDIGLGAEMVSPGNIGMLLELLEDGDRDEKSSPIHTKGAKAATTGQAGLCEKSQWQDGQGSLTSPSPAPCASLRFYKHKPNLPLHLNHAPNPPTPLIK